MAKPAAADRVNRRVGPQRLPDIVYRRVPDGPGACTALDFYDPGAASPKETWLRLLIIRAGYPRPKTQIPVLSPDGRRWYYLDMGWDDIKLAAEYDGEQHRVNPKQFAYDIQRSEDLDELGWTRIRVVKENRPADILRRLDHAWHSKLRGDREIS